MPSSQVGDPHHPHFDPREIEENEHGAAFTDPDAPPARDWGTGAGEINRPEHTRPMDPHEPPPVSAPAPRSLV